MNPINIRVAHDPDTGSILIHWERWDADGVRSTGDKTIQGVNAEAAGVHIQTLLDVQFPRR